MLDKSVRCPVFSFLPLQCFVPTTLGQQKSCFEISIIKCTFHLTGTNKKYSVFCVCLVNPNILPVYVIDMFDVYFYFGVLYGSRQADCAHFECVYLHLVCCLIPVNRRHFLSICVKLYKIF